MRGGKTHPRACSRLLISFLIFHCSMAFSPASGSAGSRPAMGGGGASALMDEEERGWFCAVAMVGAMMREGLFGAAGSGILVAGGRWRALIRVLASNHIHHRCRGASGTAFQHCPRLLSQSNFSDRRRDMMPTARVAVLGSYRRVLKAALFTFRGDTPRIADAFAAARRIYQQFGHLDDESEIRRMAAVRLRSLLACLFTDCPCCSPMLAIDFSPRRASFSITHRRATMPHILCERRSCRASTTRRLNALVRAICAFRLIGLFLFSECHLAPSPFDAVAHGKQISIRRMQ